jgi:hypothetical protein
MNYRDLQNISNLSQQILVEGANEDHNVLNRWPYTSPYLQESTELDEGAAGDVAARAQKLANQKKGQTPERKEMYQDLAYKARARQRTQDNPGDLVGASRFERSKAYGPQITPASSQRASETETIGGGTYERGSKRKPKGKKYKRQVQSGVRAASSQEKKRLGVGESYDLYDIILSHLLDEGYADSYEAAEVIMVNMSEDWKESIVEEVLDEAYVDYRKGKLSTGKSPQQRMSSRLDRMKATARRERGEASFGDSLMTPATKRSQKMGAVKREMDAHTGVGGAINKALTPGLGNRAGASPRVAYGEPNTERHQTARYKRGEPSTYT